MVGVVNTNVMSLNAQRNLNKSQATSNQAMERLSSGLRINSAKDDAAGLAISTGMQSQIKGINQGIRNANDGVSMAQTAEGAMDEMTNILQRMRELSVQSSNDTNSAENRGAIQKEVDQLHSELDRIAGTTEFNGIKLLDGSSGETTLQIGANSGESLSFSIQGVTTNDLGLNGDLNKGELNGGRATGTALADGDLLINGVDIGATTVQPGNEAGAKVEAINLKTSETGVSASAYNVVQGDAAGTAVTGITDGLTVNGTTLGATSSMDNLVETINRDVSGVNASLGDDGELLLTNDTGKDITVGSTDQGNLDAAGFSGVTAHATDSTTFTGYVALDSADDKPISVTGAAAEKAGFLKSNGAGSITGGVATAATASTTIEATDKLQINGVDIEGAAYTTDQELIDHVNTYSDETGVTMSGTAAGGFQFSAADGRGVEISSGADTQAGRTAALTKLGMQSEMGGKSIDSLGVNVSTASGANTAIDKIDDALSKISDSRADLGAIQNRLGSTVSNLENVSQNLSASNSRIQDADFAAESSKMSKAQILQQAGTSMLSQANASSQSVLSMLG
ncbi:flagellin [Psychromonas marina]|uniref:Flagellin n=1 Tax=Psychromonas marina TaxID=88364 RepID=A0ABQ6DWA3_9GAMM|nr:flagellin [Psychromonas marina]GLS89419.1 flagellin [Psychromonas marina]